LAVVEKMEALNRVLVLKAFGLALLFMIERSV
jgi:hypothetical protein